MTTILTHVFSVLISEQIVSYAFIDLLVTAAITDCIIFYYRPTDVRLVYSPT